MANYQLTNKAVEDLTNIWNYTCEEWSEAQADKYYALLLHTLEELANQKISGKVYTSIGDNILGCSVGKHIVFYQHLAKGQMLILRILHSRMDLKNRIQE